jgi:hypothetical protein
MSEPTSTTLSQLDVIGNDRSPPDGQPAFRRRSALSIVLIVTVIVTTVWTADYIIRNWGQLVEASQGKPWGGLLDPYLIAQACPHALLLLLTVIAGFYFMLRLKSARGLEAALLESLDAPISGGEDRQPRSWPWIVLGLATVAVALCILEAIEPFYFVQDDSFSNVLPGILQACRTVFRGEFPEFDPCQFMGIPSAGAGLIFYPPVLISYAIARWGMGNENYTLELFAAFHLLAGYVASFAAARVLRMRPALAYVFGISMVLSGYILMIGRGWLSVLTVVVWLPLLFVCVENWLHGRVGWRWLLTTGLAIGGFYYTGFPQLWFYAMLFLASGGVVAVICGRTTVRSLAWPIAACLLGLSMILPVLTVQTALTRGMREIPYLDMGVVKGLLATMAPFPLSHAEGFMEIHANRYPALETEWYYTGTFLMAFAYLGLGVVLAYRPSRAWIGRHPWTVVAILAFWLSLGFEGILWLVAGQLPLLRTTNHHPHRLLPFVTFFSLVVGGILLEAVLRRAASRRWEFAIAAATTILLLYHVSLSRNCFWSYGDRPYPQLPAEIARRVLPGENRQPERFTWTGPKRSGLPHFSYALPLSLPSAYGAYGFLGYDPIIEVRPETEEILRKFNDAPIEASRAYGIRWFLVSNPDYYAKERDFWWAIRKGYWPICDPFPPERLRPLLSAAKLRYRCDEVDLYELSSVSPLAFDRADPTKALSIRFHGWGGEVLAPGGGERTIVVNVAARPWLRAAGEGKLLASAPDEWNRLEVRVPDGVSRFDFYYDLPWQRGIFLGIGLAVATLAGFALVRPYLEARSA